MWTFVLILLAIWLVLSVVGFAVTGLFWLAFVGVTLFVSTAVIGATALRTPR